MRNSENVLNILSEHSNVSGYKFERLYRILFNEQMFYAAYQRIYAKQGNMTSGTDGKTVDQMSVQRIESLIEVSEMSPTSHIPQGGCTFPRRTERNDRLEYPLSRINWCKR